VSLAPAERDWRRQLEPVVAAQLERHLALAREWLPHEWLPWSRGRDFAGDGARPWAPERSGAGEAVRAALKLNLLTEDNLPSYHHEWLARVGSDGAWGAWVRRWTAEEARHAAALRDYVLLARVLDPAALERDRMAAMQAGFSAGSKDLLHALVYAALQELATRVAHRNTGRACGDPVGERLMARIAADEQLHLRFYRELVDAALAIDADAVVVAIADEVAAFAMPGAGLPDFVRASVLVADAGLYDARIHRDEVVVPLVGHWQALVRPVAGGAARLAQQALQRELGRLDEVARRQAERRARRHGHRRAPMT
jgi:acyl-[acyl-carrier-protein] desaturase